MATIYDPENEDKKTEAPTSPSGQPLQTIATASPQSTTMASPEKRPQGSGRFTNLQKYIQANQGAGQRIAGQVGQNVQKELTKEQQEAQDYYGKLGQAVQEAKGVAAQGGQFSQQLGQMGDIIGKQTLGEDSTYQDMQSLRSQEQPLSSIEQFVQDPSFKQFQEIQAGRGIDESLLGLRQAQAAREAGQYLSEAEKTQQALGTEGGRFNLLRQAFGGASRPGYTVGQQRLDQALLAQSGLGGLRRDIGQQVGQAKTLAGQTGQQAGEVSRLATQEAGLMQDIAEQAAANEQAYLNMLQSYVNPTQTAREAEWESLGERIKGYQNPYTFQKNYAYQQLQQMPWLVPESPPPEYDVTANPNYQQLPGLTGRQMQQLGLTGQEGAYNVFQNIQDASEIAKKGGTATQAQDVATTQDVARYQALADILGLDPEARRLTQESQIGEAIQKRNDEFDLANRLQTAEELFQEQLKNDINRQASFGGMTSFARGGMEDLLSRGREAIQYDRTRSVPSEIAGRAVWEDFKNFLDRLNYNRTIGGQRSSSARPGVTSQPISIGPGSDAQIKIQPEDEINLTPSTDTGKMS